MKKMLVIKAGEDIADAEITNVVSQLSLYEIEATREEINSYRDLYEVLHKGVNYDYIYLATHGCETSWGNISGTVSISWIQFAALICSSGVANPGCIFLHSCCRGGLSQVAWQMFACCEKIEFVCGPRNNVYSVDLITAFNLFLYNIEVKRIDAVRAAEKVLLATDIRLVCFDRVETIVEQAYAAHCELIKEDVDKAFDEVFKIKHPDLADELDDMRNSSEK